MAGISISFKLLYFFLETIVGKLLSSFHKSIQWHQTALVAIIFHYHTLLRRKKKPPRPVWHVGSLEVITLVFTRKTKPNILKINRS